MGIDILNRLLASWWLAMLIGIVHLAWRERASIRIVKTGLLQNHWTDFQAAKKRLLTGIMYLVGGTFMVLLAWELAFDFIKILVAATNITSEASSVHATVNIARQWLGNCVLLLTGSLIVSGELVIMSAGGRWLVTTAKVLVTASALGTIIFLLIAGLR